MNSDLAGATTSREAWRYRVAASGDRPFLHAEGRTWTYSQMDDSVARYAAGLKRLGVGLGMRVMLGLENRPHTMALHLAVTQLGAILVPLQGGLTFAELAYQIEHCESSVLIAEGPVAETILPRLAELPSVRTLVTDRPVDADGARVVSLGGLGQGDRLPWSDIPGHDEFSPALILYTSGSTGRPKGVVLPAGAPRSAGDTFNDRFGFGSNDNYFLPLTMSHAIGAVTAPSMTIVAGGSLTLVDRFSPSSFWEQVAATDATATILFPAHLNLLLETQETGPVAGESSLRLIITHRWMEDIRQRFGAELALVWGMTETGAMSTGGHPGEPGTREGYVGPPMRGVEVQVRDAFRQSLPPGETGEICLHHRHAMLGYLKDREATDSTLVDGWVHSGDYGAIDEEGNLYYLGRQKNMIKRSGENVSAEEVENALAAAPGVSECLVFGVPDQMRSEEVAAVIVLRSGTVLDEVLDRAGEQLVRWKLPRYVVATEAPLPRLGNGKLDRSGIRRNFDPAAALDRERD